MLHDIIQARGLSKPHFCNLTGLDEVYYRRAETNPDTKPSKRAIVAVACGLDMDLDTTNKLLQLAGHAFEDSDEDNALKFCITGFVGQPIDEANEFLSSYMLRSVLNSENRTFLFSRTLCLGCAAIFLNFSDLASRLFYFIYA